MYLSINPINKRKEAMSYKNQQIRVVITQWTLYGTPIPVKKNIG